MIDLGPLVQAEWNNYYAMVNEAAVKNRVYPDEPTYGSALDSWEQMPDEFREVYFPPEQHDEVTAVLGRATPTNLFF